MDIVSALALQYNLSILELLVEDFSEDKALLQGMTFSLMIWAKVRIPLLGWSSH